MIITKKKLFLRHASDFNFELNADQLLEKALECGFIKRASMGWGMKSRGLFRYNPDYVPNIDKFKRYITTHLAPIASDCDASSGLQKCNRLEDLILHAYKQYQEMMHAMGNSIHEDNKSDIIKLIETEKTGREPLSTQRQVHGESVADQFIDDMMDEQMRPDDEVIGS